MVMEPVPHPKFQFVADMSSRDIFLSIIHVCLSCTSILIGAILGLSFYNVTDQLRVFAETGSSSTSVTDLQRLQSDTFPALALCLVLLQFFLFTYGIGFFVWEMSPTFSAVNGVILLFLNCLLGTLVLFWIWGGYWVVTILAAILYELSFYTTFLKISIHPTYFGPHSRIASEIADGALSSFNVLAGSFIFPVALLSALGEARDTGPAWASIVYAWTPIIHLLLVNFINISVFNLAIHNSRMWCFGATWASFLIYLLNPAPNPIRCAACICTVVQFMAFMFAMRYKTSQKEMKKPNDEEMGVHSPGPDEGSNAQQIAISEGIGIHKGF